MTKEVAVTIEGRQPGSGREPIIVTAFGTYHLQNGGHYIQCDEMVIKISLSRIEITKKGAVASQLFFDINKATEASYQTPYGSLYFDVKTSGLSIEEFPDRINVNLEYSLFDSDTHVSDFKTEISIAAKGDP